MERCFIGGKFVGGEIPWWRGDWIPERQHLVFLRDLPVMNYGFTGTT